MTTLVKLPTASVTILLLVAAFAFALAVHAPRPSSAASLTPGDLGALYKAKCAACHGADGSGTAAGRKLGAHDFRTFKGNVYTTIANGKGRMPAYGKRLGAEKCKALAEYVHENFQ